MLALGVDTLRAADATWTGGAAPNAIVVQVQPPSVQVAPGGAVSFCVKTHDVELLPPVLPSPAFRSPAAAAGS